MNWFTKYLSSSPGQKILMSLTGLFLCQFLVVHLLGNVQLLIPGDGTEFNEYSEFMGNFLPIKIVAILLYVSILLHAVIGIGSALKNKRARGPQRYKVKSASKTTFSSRNMGLLGSLILAFILIHMSQFWWNSKFGAVKAGEISYYDYAVDIFSHELNVVVYLVGQLVLGLHLYHGFQSAFQTLGLNHSKYTPLIKKLGAAFAVLLPLGFAAIALGMYLGWTFEFLKALH